MQFQELLTIYFERSNALETLWTIYISVAGALLAFFAIREKRDLVMPAILTAAFCLFVFVNVDAMQDITKQRQALVRAITAYHPSPDGGLQPAHFDEIKNSLVNPTYAGVLGLRNFHLATDVLVLAAVWTLSLRKHKKATATP